jgi:hypothetical protein
VIHIYAFTEHDAAPDGVMGLDERPVEVVPSGPVAAVVSDLAGAPSAEAAVLWRHEAVIEALMRAHAVLPARFGALLDDRAAVRALLGRNATVLGAGLERVRGLVEVGVRIRHLVDGEPEPAPSPATSTSSGRDYLLARRDALHAEDDAATRIHEALAARAREAVQRRGEGRGASLVGAYLVDPAELEAFTAEVAAFRDPDLQVVCTGPWPPYHFVPQLEEAGRG